MPRPPRIPPKEITERIKEQLARYDRNPFKDVLADALTVAPSKTAWRRFAKKDPGKYSQAIATLAKPAGFAEKSESLVINMDANKMAQELIARFGREKGQQLLEAAGLPTSLIATTSQPDKTPVPIENEPIEVSRESEITR